jgi:ubiquitin carboxyl-terminal hydrolase 20/33
VQTNAKDIDSGVFSLKSQQMDGASVRKPPSSQPASLPNCNNSGDESIDSFETCGEDENVAVSSVDEEEASAKTSTSNELHFSDADDQLKPLGGQRNDAGKTNKTIAQSKSLWDKKRTEKEDEERKKETQETRPVFSSIVSELFDGKIISQVQCLECNHLSTTTETFQHLSLPIPSKEYLQALHNKIIANQQNKSSVDRSTESSVPYQSWLGWMMSFMKGYIYTSNIELTECLTAFFSDDDLKGDNMYSCEKCKKLTNGVKYSKILNLPEVVFFFFRNKNKQMKLEL